MMCLDFFIHVELRISTFRRTRWRAIAQTAVRSLVVILFSPVRDLRPGIGQVTKAAGIQTLIPQSSIEALHVAVLHRSPRLNVDQLDLPLLAPAQEVPRG